MSFLWFCAGSWVSFSENHGINKSTYQSLYPLKLLILLKVRNGYSVTADIDTDYLLIGRNGEYNLPIKKEDFQDCQVYQQKEQQFFCGFGPMLQSKKSPNCAIQLFNVEGNDSKDRS